MNVEASTMLADDCYRCGYDLRGIGDEQPCPECGLLARRSRRVSDELRDTRPRWLRRISRGANLMLLALIVVLVWPFVWQSLLFHLQLGGIVTIRPSLLFVVLPFIGLDLAAVLLFAGVWLLTSPEGYPPADRADRRMRVILRVAASAPLAALTLYSVEAHLNHRAMIGGTYRAGWGPLEWTALLLSTVATAPLPVLLFMHLRGLAKRVRSAHLAEHCLIVGIGTSAAFVYGGALSLLREFAEQWGLGSNWMNRSDVALGMTVAMSVASLLFKLWSIYLLVRFAIAFHRAARQLRGRWNRDDCAATAGPPRDAVTP